MSEPDPKPVEKPNDTVAQIGLFIVGLFAGVFGYYVFITVGILMLYTAGSPTPLAYIIVALPPLLAAVGVLLALRGRKMRTAWFLIGVTCASLGSSIVCSVRSLS